MDFTETIIEYYQGERNEASYLFILGLILLVISIIIWFNLNSNVMLKGKLPQNTKRLKIEFVKQEV